MSSTSTTWSSQGNTKAGATSTSTDSLTTGTLTADTIQLASNIIKASDGGETITLDTADNVTILGDLIVTGNNLTFGNGEGIANVTDSTMSFSGGTTYSFSSPSSDCKMHLRGQSATSSDVGLVLYNHTGIGAPEWSICFDDSDSDTLKFDAGTATVGGATKFSLTESGNAAIAGDLDVDGTTNLDAVDIDGNVQLDGTFTVGVNDAGYDVKLFGNTAASYMLWDTSADQLRIVNDAITAGLVLENTEDGATNSPAIDYYRNSASAAASDVLGITTYVGRNGANDADVIYARLQSSIVDATKGGEEGAFKIGVMGNGAFQQDAISLVGTSSGNIDINIGHGTTSSTKVKGYFAANSATPAAAPDWTVSNKSGTPRTLDANGNIAAIGDNLAQLVDDLIAIGILQ